MVCERFIGSGRLQEGGFLGTHKQDFESHRNGCDWRHDADHIDMNPIIPAFPGINVQETLELIASGITSSSGLAGVLSIDNNAGAYAIDMNSNFINNLLDPVLPQDAATKYYVDQLLASGLSDVLSIDNSAGSYAIDMNNNFINNLLDPVLPQDAATKYYVDQLVAIESLYETLTAGNSSSGVDINLNNGSRIINTSVGGGFTVQLTANPSGLAGDFNFYGSNGTTAGSDFAVFAGHSTTTGSGGSVSLFAGASSGGVGGNILQIAGSSVSGGNVLISAGNGTSGTGGNISITAGIAGTGMSGSINIQDGSGAINGSGIRLISSTSRITVNKGDITINAGDPLLWPHSDGSPGQVMVTDGAGNLSFSSVSGGGENLYETLSIGNSTGGVSISSSGGAAVITKSDSGTLSINAGQAPNSILVETWANAGSVNAGDITISTGGSFSNGYRGGYLYLKTSNSNYDPGDIYILGGSSVNNDGANVNINAGSSTNNDGGNSYLVGGSSSAGNGGLVYITGGSTGSTTYPGGGDINITGGSGRYSGNINISNGSFSTGTGYINIIGANGGDRTHITLQTGVGSTVGSIFFMANTSQMGRVSSINSSGILIMRDSSYTCESRYGYEGV
jgi:hypothetical protein